jgi:outer membrane receptor protein involved in Fe transport
VAQTGPGVYEPVTLDPSLMAALARIPPQLGGPILFPWKVATYLNLGPIRNEGVEASIAHRFTPEVGVFANYSYQRAPKILDPSSDQIRYPISEVGIPARNRLNVGVSYDGPLVFGSVDLNYSDKALWADVLGSEYHGYTDPYALLNATVGVRLGANASLSLRGTNLLNEKGLQHVYGDLIRRSVAVELRLFSR